MGKTKPNVGKLCVCQCAEHKCPLSPPTSLLRPGMGKTKLLNQVRHDIEDIAQQTAVAAAAGCRPFHIFHYTAGVAHRSAALYPWRVILQKMFAVDRWGMMCSLSPA